MSCDTLNVGAVQLDVSVASLPEGFCPASMQELANAIASRLIISPSTEFNTFAIGSTAPASNVGPWLKDCLQWFVFDDATATYVPITKGGFDSLQYITANTTFTVPDFIYKIKVHAFGAGGGGSSTSGGAANGSGGGGGAYGLSIINVTPGQAIPIVIGTGGGTGANGTATTILGRSAGGGAGSAALNAAGAGGTATGFDVNLSGQTGEANSGSDAGFAGSSGGDAGGWGGKGGTTASPTPSNGGAGTSPGGGGSGGNSGASSVGGAGAGGAILIEY